MSRVSTIFSRKASILKKNYTKYLGHLGEKWGHILNIRFRFSTDELPLILTPWSRGLLEKLTVSQLVKKLPAFYGTPRFITAFTRVRHLSLS
jgi:hypothetical protein